MKTDDLEKKIAAEREKLDRLEPVPVDRIWNKMKPHLPVREPSSAHPWQIGRNWRLLMLAASLALIVGVSLWLLMPRPQADPEFRVAHVLPELAPQEQAYLKKIAERESEMDLTRIDRQVFQDVFRELEELENARKQAKPDIESHPDKDEIVSILMRYYERKLLILDRLEKELNRNKIQKQRDEKLPI
jgi:hypothetical protein